MTQHPYEDLTRAERRRLLRRALLRPLLGAIGMLALYFLLPLNRSFSALTVFWLIVGLLGVAALVVFQVRAIIRSPYPRLTAIEALATAVPLFIVLFAATYFVMEGSLPSSFNQPLSRIDSLYFTVTALATVGFGDIVPVSEQARVLVTVQMVGGLILFGLAARVVLQAVQLRLTTRQEDTGSR